MASLNVTMNENCGSETSTPGQFNVLAHYTETDAGFAFGVFTSRERAEACLLVLAGRADVVLATIEEVP